MTIVEFLTARLDERERDRLDELDRSSRIRVIAHPNQRTGQRVAMCDDCNDWATEGPTDAVRAEATQHVRERHDYERVLADIAAKRAIVKLHGDSHECPDGWLDSAETTQHTGWVVDCLTLRHLASVDADHSDYQQEWKP